MFNRLHIFRTFNFSKCFIPRSRKSWSILLVSILSVYLITWFALPFAFPYQPQATTGEETSLIVLDKSGNVLHHKSREDYYRLTRTKLSEIPEDLINATLAAEDKRFFRHGGVDFFANLRAIKDGIISGRMVSGASTITQQTIKLSSPKAERNLKTKIIEAFTARHLELTTDKEIILTSYFNHLDYGNHMLGPKQAALHYFGRPLHALSLAECALLAGLPQSPSKHNPRKNLERAKKRRDWILDRMQLVHDMPAKRIQRAKEERITLSPPRYQTNAPMIAALAEKLSGQRNATVRTTIDSGIQSYAQEILQRELARLELHEKNVSNGAVVVIDNHTREVIALVGTHDFHSAESGQINAAFVPRSPGSALKPLAYILASDELGIQPASIIPDIETFYAGELGADEFVNYSRTHSGPITAYHALGNSLNIPIIRVINQMGGPAKLLEIYQKIGFDNLKEKPGNYGLGLAIGSGEVSLFHATNAFATISQQGMHTTPRIIQGQPQEKPKQLFTADSAFLITSILSDNSARTSSFGTHSHLRLPFPCAVKTGTSTDFRDNWCLGFTRDFTIGVWVGNLDNSAMRGITGVSGAGPIFKSIMLELHRNQNSNWYDVPPSIQQVTVDPHTGKQLPANHPRSHLGVRTYAQRRALPYTASDSDYDSEGRVYLDNTYRSWLDENPNKAFIPNKLADINKNLRIISPSKNSRFLLDPDLPNNGKFLTLKSNSGNPTQWASDTLEITTHENLPIVILKPGVHKVTATDSHTRESQTIEFTVRSL